MGPETKTCQNCKQPFVIDLEDFRFYEKINVPPPTWCPDCRLQRRLSFLNHRTLYKRNCSSCGKSMVSLYDTGAPFPVYCPDCWWSDKWDSKSYGRPYDFLLPFFEQFKRLSMGVPRMSLEGLHETWINSEYNNLAHELKNCYLLFNSDVDENCLYGSEVESSNNCVDTTMIESSELCYGSINLVNCHRVFFSADCVDCHNVWFGRDLANCNDCFGCTNLRNRKYHIFNKSYSKEDYAKEIATFGLSSRAGIAECMKRTQALSLSFPRKFMHGRHNVNVSGDYVNYSKNTHDAYIALGAEDCRYAMWLIIKPNRDCYDFTQFGGNAERVYESLVCGKGVSDTKFSINCVDEISSVTYSDHSFCSNAFGCVSLKKGNKYCILNKQYAEDEYRALVPKIVAHMNEMPYVDRQGREYRYGEFFPPELSLFAYNETEAQGYFPLTKAEALRQGFLWKEPDTKSYKITLSGAQIPDSLRDTPDAIVDVDEVLECAHKGQCNEQCATAFRIIPDELTFYKKFSLPIPNLCSNCRSAARLALRNGHKLWHRKCECARQKSDNGAYQNAAAHFHAQGHCPNEFETSYAPDRPEIVYCEQCYNAEVV